MKKERVFSEGSLHVQRSIFKRAFSGVAFRPSNLGLFGSSLQPGAREKKEFEILLNGKNFSAKTFSSNMPSNIKMPLQNQNCLSFHTKLLELLIAKIRLHVEFFSRHNPRTVCACTYKIFDFLEHIFLVFSSGLARTRMAILNTQYDPCLLSNQKGVLCRHPCDPFGHHSFICKTTTKTADHNLARDILATMGNAFGFIASKEVVVAPWFKKPDVELIDSSGELLTIYLDVTLPALHQEAIASRDDVYNN